VAAFCRRHHITQLALFGSVLRDDFRPDSDVDVLVEFQPGHVPGLDFVSIEREFSGLLQGRRVDMVTPKFLNPRIRDQVLTSAEPLYVAAWPRLRRPPRSTTARDGTTPRRSPPPSPTASAVETAAVASFRVDRSAHEENRGRADKVWTGLQPGHRAPVPAHFGRRTWATSADPCHSDSPLWRNSPSTQP
jgi:predicted nucleotidyltransferase